MNSDYTIDDLINDRTVSLLESALRSCGLPLSLSEGAYRRVRTGGWHDVYRVTVPQHAHPYVVRIRNSEAYGKQRRYADHAADWHAEYVATSLYYMQANRAVPNICPTIFLYHVSEEMTCTVETYMGPRLQLHTLDKHSARQIGRQVGQLVRELHQRKVHINGEGYLKWDGANLHGQTPRRHSRLANTIERTYNENILGALIDDGPSFNHRLVAAKLTSAHLIRDVDEPLALINRDITPEHLTLQQSGTRIGVINPSPYIGNGTRFAAWFIHAYRYLLPSYAQTERYGPHRYDEHADVLGWIADGFELAYTDGDYELSAHIAAERWLWILEQAYSDLQRLQMAEIPQAKIIKHGTQEVMYRRLRRSLHTLETFDF